MISNFIRKYLYRKFYISKYSEKETDLVLNEIIELKEAINELVDANLFLSEENENSDIETESLRKEVHSLSSENGRLRADIRNEKLKRLKK